jgi:hypothetical protein
LGTLGPPAALLALAAGVRELAERNDTAGEARGSTGEAAAGCVGVAVGRRAGFLNGRDTAEADEADAEDEEEECVEVVER